MGAIRTPRGKWIEAGLRALSAGGPDAVRVEALAQALGVSKGGFYGYFANRDALLTEMLETWEREVTDETIGRVEAEGGDARERLARLTVLASSGAGLLTDVTTDLAIRDWARRDPAVAERLRRADNRRMAYLRSLYGEFCADEADVEARCMVTFSVWIGNHLVAADHGPRSRTDVLQTIRARLLAP
ncbi:TetR family transcriptional regulator [Streptomyces mashuensis]|uniref:TetR family transcriptional regulator n=1 Tax=Streptomyces mashuensis TaxID=33904 RepID=A0A919B4J8_9ACTN|nr:TetR/AcrR family transcriptional regulator [Streptomyces mashuensis]GHF46959.1 TetR family transcriptional regulator [Streptomyces mashuensis]